MLTRLTRTQAPVFRTSVLRTFSSGAPPAEEQIRQLKQIRSALGDLVTIEHGEGGIAKLLLNRGPVNSLNLEMLQSIHAGLAEVHADKSVKGIVLGTTKPGIFSAGLDIMEMYEPDEERLNAFWSALQDVWIELYGSRLPTVAAVEGHSPAGGCLLAMSCDERVMATGKYKIGLNETLLGIVAPPWFIDTMVNTIGHRESERMLGLGRQVDAEAALAMGLVDAAVPLEDVVSTSEGLLSNWMRIPAAARFETKCRMRSAAIEKLKATRDQDRADFVNFCLTDKVQASLGAYIASLKKPRK
jgi:3,2-trans-enoyl-CoA isomerase